MPNRFKIVIVEDDALLREMFEGMLVPDYQVAVFADAESCLACLGVEQPDMFLLDVGLPGLDGYGLCRRIKADPAMADIPVTFVSGHDDIEARLAGYDAGGEDFICKPFEPSELIRKVMRARQLQGEKEQLKEMAGHAQRTAFLAMSGMGELGVVIEFMRKSFACTDGLTLARQILDTLAQYGLAGAVQVRLGGRTISLSEEGQDLPLETAILNHVRGQGRIFEFKRRGVYNYGGVTVLVKNMPIEDPERCGRLRDNLAILAEGADARRHAIELAAGHRQARDGIGSALAELQAMLLDLKAGQASEQAAGAEVMADLQAALLNAFVSLGLTERQEESLAAIVRYHFERLGDHSAHGQALLERLGQVAGRLGALA